MRSVSWWLGDWWAFGEALYGLRKAIVEAEDWEGPGWRRKMQRFKSIGSAQRFHPARAQPLTTPTSSHNKTNSKDPADCGDEHVA